MKQTIRCAVVGYGPSFNFGKAHATWLSAAPGLELAAGVGTVGHSGPAG